MRTDTIETDRKVAERVPWFAGLSDRDRTRLLRLGTVCRVSAGRELTVEGAPGREAFVVLDGTARVTIGGHLVAHAGPGDFVGEMALADHGPRSAGVIADTAMTLLVFDPRSFATLLDEPAVGRALRRALVARLRSTTTNNNNRRNGQ